jgi:hypothetical protein
MNKFYLKFVATFLVGVSVLTGACATLDQHSAAVQLIVSQATMRYLESASPITRVERAANIVRITVDIERVASGEPITISSLAQLALSAIPSNLPPSDRALAISIVQIAAQELQNKIGEQVLKPDQLVTVKAVVEAIRQAASIYAGSAS